MIRRHTYAVVMTGTLFLALIFRVPAQDQEQSLFTQWQNVLEYGIDSEVLDLIEQIENHGTDRFDDSLVTRFEQTRSSELRIAIIRYFTRSESDHLGSAVRTLFLSDSLLSDDLLRACVSYLADVVKDDGEDILSRYREMAEGSNVLAATVAIGAIGRSGAGGATDTLLQLYEDLDSDDARNAVLRALGATGSTDAVPFLTDIALDEYEISLYRQSAALSLGEITAPESQETLSRLLTSDDSVLRAYAVQAIGHYHNDEAAETLTGALRDSFWRVRVAALEGLAEQGGSQALPAVAYKARNDPEARVREAAIDTLGQLGGTEALDVLRAIASDARVSDAVRVHALNALAESDLDGSIDFLLEQAEEQWTREDSVILDAIGRIASTNESAALEPLLTRLFSHSNYIIRIYAIRGMGRNGLTRFEQDLIEVADESAIPIVKTTARAALEQMGVVYVPEDERGGDEEQPDADSPAQE